MMLLRPPYDLKLSISTCFKTTRSLPLIYLFYYNSSGIFKSIMKEKLNLEERESFDGLLPDSSYSHLD